MAENWLNHTDTDTKNAVEQFIRQENLSHINDTLEHTGRILSAFSKFPYENLSKIIRLNENFSGSPFRKPADVLEDYYRNSLGGTCFSLTYFLKSIMDWFGYNTHVIMADMNCGPNTHCALVLDEKGIHYLLDPGYLIYRPLLIFPGLESVPVHGAYLKNSKVTGGFELFTVKNMIMVRRYRFFDKPTPQREFFSHWERSFHWMTMHGICLSKNDLNGFIYMHNKYLKLERNDQRHKGNFTEPVSVIANRYFNIPEKITLKAEKALNENLRYDRELGYEVPKRLKNKEK